MSEARLFLVLLAAVAVLALLARRLPLPAPVVLVIGGLGLGALPFVPRVTLSPEVVLLVFLPAILFPAAVSYAREDVVPAIGSIGSLAIGLVLATTAAVAAAAHVVLGLPWGPAVVLGAVLAPTDPVSATSILRASGAPSRIATILEGESLVNDGTAVTLFRTALGTLGASFSVAGSLADFAAIALGGAAVGLLIGAVVSRVLAELDDVEIESVIAVLTAYGSYVVAEQVGVSGILSTVLAGYVVGRRRSEITSPETRLRSGSFWSLLEFISVSVLFVLIGLEISKVLPVAAARSGASLVIGVLATTAAVAATRLVWMFTVPLLVGLVGPGDRGRSGPPRESLVLVLGGMRGAVSVAVALAIPLTIANQPFPERDTVIFVALASVVVLLVGPALALPPALRRLGLVRSADDRRLSDARAALAEAALARAKQIEDQGQAPDDLVIRASDVYEGRLASERLRDDEETNAERSDRRDAYRQILRALLNAERRRLDQLRSEGAVTGETLNVLEHDLDLEEQRLR